MKRLALLRIVAVIIPMVVGLLLVPSTYAGPPGQRMEPVPIYFFWGDGCPHCAAAKPFLAQLKEKYPNVIVRDYEVWKHPENFNFR